MFIPRWGKLGVDEKLALGLKPMVKTDIDVGTVGLTAEGLLPSTKVKQDRLSKNVWKQEFARVPDVAQIVTSSTLQ